MEEGFLARREDDGGPIEWRLMCALAACMHGINESLESDVRGLAPVIAIK